MRFYRRYVAIGMSVGLLMILFGVGYLRSSAAYPPPVADFTPRYTHAEAEARVAAAQARQEQERQELLGLAEMHALPELPTVYVEQSGHHLSNRTGFLDFWRSNGQVQLFGYPITEEIVEDGRVVQYFERARFEYHPDVEQMKLGLVGREYTNAYGHDLPPVGDPQNGVRYFPETQHTLFGELGDFWGRRGGVSIFGYPISEEIEENGRVVRYFERARFEYHPEDAAFYERYSGFPLDTLHKVRLGDLGRHAALLRGVSTEPVARLDGVPTWSPALWDRHIKINLSTLQLTAYEGDVAVYSAPVATGRDGFNTAAGSFAVYDKLPVQTMQGSAGGESWYVPDVPWVMYIHGGVALHGTYWHNLFGQARTSHGCINLSIADAQWLYEWADIGTAVTVHY